MKLSKLNIGLIALSILLFIGASYYANKANSQPKSIKEIVQSEIPKEYKEAHNFYYNYFLKAKTPSKQESLKGIKTLCVSVNVYGRVKDRIEIKKLRTKIEILLRQNGIIIINNPEKEKPGIGLFCEIETMPINENQDIISIKLETLEAGIFAPSSKRDFLETPFYLATSIWAAGSQGYAGIKKTEEHIMKTAESLTEEFINDWLAANPPKRDS